MLPVVLLFLPLLGVASAAAYEALRQGKPAEGSVFRIEGQGDQTWIILDGQRRAIDTSALELLGYDINSERIKKIEEEKINDIPIGETITVQLIHAMKIN